MDILPIEIVWQIFEFLSPYDLAHVQLVCRRFLPLARETNLWKALCFDDSTYDSHSALHRNVRPRAGSIGSSGIISSAPWSTLDITRVVPGLLSVTPPSSDNESSRSSAMKDGQGFLRKEESVRDKRARAITDWDPSYPEEKVDWMSEYIARHAPPSVSWLQQPVDGSRVERIPREIRGIGHLKDNTENGMDKIVGPLEDGSLCIWDLRSSYASNSVGQKGSILARSEEGLLFNQPFTNQDPGFVGVDECVTVDSARNRVYIAVHNTLNEVDIETLKVVSQEKYPWFISALSEVTYPLPVTVGTTLSLHLHDPRQSNNVQSGSQLSSSSDRLDHFNSPSQASLPSPSRNDFHRLFSGDAMPEYASLFQPNPLSIHHLPSATSLGISNSILVAGRFPSILHYDRRSFPRLAHTLHSGARLSCLTSLPYPPQFFHRTSTESSASPDPAVSTLIAAGEYNGRGSLELYSFPPPPVSHQFPQHQSFHSPTTPPPSPPPQTSNKNRQTTSSSKLLSAVSHGTRILFSDAEGALKWVERDGRTLVRRWNINAFSYSVSNERGTGRTRDGRNVVRPWAQSNAHGEGNMEEYDSIVYRAAGEFGPKGSDVVRKIIPTNGQLEDDNLVLWTGEKVSVMRFHPQPEWIFDYAEDEVDRDSSGKAATYERLMRRALERQADEVRWMGRFGFMT